MYNQTTIQVTRDTVFRRKIQLTPWYQRMYKPWIKAVDFAPELLGDCIIKTEIFVNPAK